MPKTKANRNNPHSVHPGVLAVQNWIKTLPEKPGARSTTNRESLRH